MSGLGTDIFGILLVFQDQEKEGLIPTTDSQILLNVQLFSGVSVWY